jgi:hypothetical protein
MQHLKIPQLVLVFGAFMTASGAAQAQQPGQVDEGPAAIDAEQAAAPVAGAPAANLPVQENPIPPNVEGQAVPQNGGGYCYGGPHPAPGGGWEASTAPHMHAYAPFDLRLFAFHDGCYYFVGDPRDFGYTAQTYSYYGAHPIADAYGGGWCFMIGAHAHWWRPWSPYFTVVGPWYYWNGPYDPFFWAYWPYYSFYYRSYYPSYYAGGRFYRNNWRAAPPITRVPPTGWRGSPGVAGGGGWRGAPPSASSSPLHSGGAYGGGWRGAPPAGGGGWQAAPGGGGGGWRGSPVPNTSSPLRSSPSFGGGGGWHAPSGGGWHGSSGGGFRGGGGGGGWRGGGRR